MLKKRAEDPLASLPAGLQAWLPAEGCSCPCFSPPSQTPPPQGARVAAVRGGCSVEPRPPLHAAAQPAQAAGARGGGRSGGRRGRGRAAATAPSLPGGCWYGQGERKKGVLLSWLAGWEAGWGWGQWRQAGAAPPSPWLLLCVGVPGGSIAQCFAAVLPPCTMAGILAGVHQQGGQAAAARVTAARVGGQPAPAALDPLLHSPSALDCS